MVDAYDEAYQASATAALCLQYAVKALPMECTCQRETLPNVIFTEKLSDQFLRTKGKTVAKIHQLVFDMVKM